MGFQEGQAGGVSSPTEWLPAPDECENLVESTCSRLPNAPETPADPDSAKPATECRPALQVALQLQELLDTGVVNSRADLARRRGLSRARVTQMLSILELPQAVLAHLSGLPPPEQAKYTERRLRAITGLADPLSRLSAFEELRDAVEGVRLAH